MTIDDLGRAAAAEVRAGAAAVLDPDAMLARLHRTRRRRATGAIIGVLVAAAVAGALVINHQTRADSHQRPAVTPAPPSTGICAYPGVRCPSRNTFRFVDLPVPFTVVLPANFRRDFAIGTDSVEAYRNDIGSAGVTVSEHARPVKYGPVAWKRDPAAGTTAESMARWLSTRPFLMHTTLTETTVGRQPAWLVTGDLKPNASLPAAKIGGDVAPTFGSSVIGEGYRADLTGQYTLLDVPGAGVTVIWSWTLNHGDQVLAGNQRFIDGLSFG